MINQVRDFISSQHSITLSGSTIVIISAILVAIFIFLLVNYILLSKRLKDKEKPKYGFLGKPLYQSIIIIALTGAIGFTSYQATFNQGPDFSAAEEEINVDFTTSVIRDNQNSELVRFEVVPIINDQEWGSNPNDTFDIYLNINGEENITKIFTDASKDKPVNFTENLTNGSYEIRITIISDSYSEVFTRELDI
jgi:hypothetical protein